MGYNYLRVAPVSEAGETRLRYEYEDLLMLKRFDTVTVVTSKIVSWETPDGRPIHFTSEVKTGPGSVVTEGRLAGEELSLTTRNLGAGDRTTIPWEPGWGGFFADRQMLRRRPLRPRETRSLKALLPLLNQVGDMHFQAETIEAVKLLEGSRQLLRISVTTVVGGSRIKSLLWTDDRGEVVKMHDQQVGLDAYLTTREIALRRNEPGGFDLGNDAVVRIVRPLVTPHETRRITYRARLKEGDIAGLFATAANQSVRAVDGRTVEITVTRIRPNEPETVPSGTEAPASDRDRSASTLLQCGDAVVMQMAGSVASDEADPWKLACALERYVKGTVQLKGYSTALATAAEVARTRTGDCTEHAMLLAALCRARKIPARVAIGLVYYPPAQGFAYHMWTEVWIKDRWIGVDGTLGLGGVGAAHLKLASSSLQGVSAYAELLPVLTALGRLELELLTVE